VHTESGANTLVMNTCPTRTFISSHIVKSLTQQRMGLAVVEELVLKEPPGATSVELMQHQGLAQVVGDGVVDPPRQHRAVHMDPDTAVRQSFIG